MNILENPAGPVAVIGLGLMGRSIAACLLAAGHRVTGVTDNLEASAAVLERIRELLAEMTAEGLLADRTQSLIERLRITADLGDIADAEIVFESITEDLALKRELLHSVEGIVSSTCLFATNTSALPVSLLQEGASHPERILGIHWDEPAHVTRFMEIIPGRATLPRYLEQVAALAVAWGKEPSTLRREIRGFITNRISYAMFREACHLVDSGVCSVEDVDRSLRNDVGWWIPFAGPFRYMDLMGVEGYYRVMRDLLPDLCNEPGIPRLMREVVESGGRGVANGRGFYRYTPEEAKAWEEKYIEFNYKIRQLTAEYADVLATGTGPATSPAQGDSRASGRTTEP
ncbi:MAG TPA: 3-hydroxyacyl-CoA dehydrogenase family protein [Acidobacteriaceae bacterium]|nr:3-hydroxyacyl-CoA dehydrogenase family protein [Acidobacteriaceae bacterium]